MQRIKILDALKRIKELKDRKIIAYGPEEYLVNQFLKKLGEFYEIEKFYADENIEGFLAREDKGLFSTKDTIKVLLKGDCLSSVLRKKADKEKFLKSLREKERFVIVLSPEFESKKWKTELYQEITKIAEVLLYAEKLPRETLIKRILSKLESKGVDRGLAELVVDIAGEDLGRLKLETDKLLEYPGKLTPQVVSALVFSGSEVNVFEIIYLLVGGEKKEFLKELEKALLTVDPLVLVGLFQSQVRQLINLSLGISTKNPKNVERLYVVARKRKPGWFLNLLRVLHEIEFEIKSGEGDKNALKKLVYVE
jgi:DNA polymerase-3 subunit delta